MYEYKIVDNSIEDLPVKMGKASLQKLKQILPEDIYEMLLRPGTISVKVITGHMSYEVSKV